MKDTKKTIYVIDRYTNKYYWLQVASELEFSVNEKVVIEYKGDKDKQVQSIGLVIGEQFTTIDRVATYIDRCSKHELQEMSRTSAQEQEKYKIFKKEFKKAFPTSKPITARYHIISHQWYFYFYSEERYNFVEFIKRFREINGGPFFLYQVGAREMVRMSPWSEFLVWENWKQLMFWSQWPLPQVSIEDVMVQHLEGRDIERLKDLSGKLKSSLAYEVDLYREESKLFPPKWSKVQLTHTDQEATVLNFNILTRKVDVLFADGIRISLPLEDIKKVISTKNNYRSQEERELLEAARKAVD